MRELLTLWRNTRMIVLVAQIAAFYAAVMIPFKIIQIIPGITELRPATVIPVVCGILFGPAAAWGSAFGNLIADFFGTLGPGSIAGFVANFLYGYVPYRVWKLLSDGRERFDFSGRGPRTLAAVLLVSTVVAILVYGVIFSGALLPYAYWITLALLGIANGLLLWTARRWQAPQSLDKVMDPNRGDTGRLLVAALPGPAAMLIVALWGTPANMAAVFALAELIVLGNAALLGVPIWLGISRDDETRRATRTLGRFVVASLAAALVCALTVGVGVDLLKVAPFQFVAPIVLVNNLVLTLLLGPLLLGVLYPRVSRWGLLVADVLPATARSEGHLPGAGLLLLGTAAVLGLIVGCWIGFAPEQAAQSLSSLGLSVSPQAAAWQATMPFFVAVLAGAALL